MKFFDSIAKAITSLGAVVFVLMMVIIAMVFFSHTLFTQALPETMADWEKIAAAWFLALGYECTVLLTTCNTKHLDRRIPYVMAVCSGIILLFFVQAFDFTQSPIIICQRWFVGILIAAINFIYADLFYAKWMERIELTQRPMKLDELQSRVNELQSAIAKAQPKLDQLKELEGFKRKIDQELTCPHCKNLQPSYGTLHSHKGHCSQNPKNRKHENNI